MAKKKHLSAMSMIDDEVMAPPKSSSDPSRIPVAQNMAQSRQSAKEKIDTLQAQLDKERERRLQEVTRLQQHIEQLNKSGGDPAQVEEAVEQAKRLSEEREQSLLNDINVANEQVSALEKQLAEAPDDGVYELDPHRVRPSRFANRHMLSFEGEDFEKFRTSIRKLNGNEIAAKVRRLTDNPDFDYEVVYGHRRHKATSLEQTPFYAKVVDLTDAELVQLMHIENQRLDLSSFEEGFQFKQWLDEGFYKNVTTLAAAIDESKSFVSQRLAITDLPEAIFVALKDPRQVGLRNWRALCRAYRENPDTVLGSAKTLTSGSDTVQAADKAEVDAICRRLIAGAEPQPPKAEVKTVTLSSGTPLFQSEKKASGYSIKLDSKGLAVELQEEALAELERFLKKRLGE